MVVITDVLKYTRIVLQSAEETGSIKKQVRLFFWKYSAIKDIGSLSIYNSQ